MSLKNWQVYDFQIAPVILSGVTVSSGSIIVTTNISTALNTAGNGNVAVTSTTSTGITVEGVIVTTINNTTNKVKIFNTNTQSEILDSSGNQVYGRLTYSGNAYTVTFYSNVSGTETAYTFGSTTSIDIVFNYLFTRAHYPVDGNVTAQNYNFDVQSVSVPTTIREVLTITTANTVPNLAHTPLNGVSFIYNNLTYTSVDPSPVFAIGGTGNKVVTFTATNDTPTVQLPTGAIIIAVYEY